MDGYEALALRAVIALEAADTLTWTDIIIAVGSIGGIIIGFAQCYLIYMGLQRMEATGRRRDQQLEQQGNILAEIGAGLRETGAGIKEVLERTAPPDSHQNTEQDPENWIERRAACNVKAVFAELCQRLAADVENMDRRYRVDPEVNRDKVFGFEQKTPQRAVVWGQSVSGMTEVVFQVDRQHDQITIDGPSRPGTGVSHQVTCRWNADTASRALFLNEEKPVEIWEISEQALSPLFFDEQNPASAAESTSPL